MISSTARLTINVLDVNDNAPRFRPFGVTNFTEKILEGAQPGTTLLSVSAVDPDKGPNGQIIYQLLHLPRGGYVRLEDPSVGGLSLAACCHARNMHQFYICFHLRCCVLLLGTSNKTECNDLLILFYSQYTTKTHFYI